MEALGRETELELEEELEEHNRNIGENAQQNDRNAQSTPKTSMIDSVILDREGSILTRQDIEGVPGYTKVKNTSSVKSLLRHVDNYEAAMKCFVVPENKQEIGEMNGRVFSYMEFMEKYLKKKAHGYAKKGKKYAGIMGMCAHAAIRTRIHRDFVIRIMERALDGDEEVIGKSYTDLLKLDKSRFFRETEKSNRRELGKGQINTVYRVNDIIDGNKERVLKDGSMEMDVRASGESEVYTRMKLEQYKSYSELESELLASTDEEIKKIRNENKVNKYINSVHRDVAVSMIDRLFNLNSVVKTSMAINKKNQKSSLMDFAPGGDLSETFAYMGEQNKEKAKVLMECDKYEKWLINGQRNEEQENKKRQVVNIGSSKFLESTYNLAALDIIVGHVDRHGKNMKVTADGVKGIDNDTSFTLASTWGEIENFKGQSDSTLYKGLRRTAKKSESGESEVQVYNSEQARLYFNTAFPVVPRSFKDKICNVKGKAVRGALKGLLEEPEIEACVARVKALQEYLKKNAEVVDDFDNVDMHDYATQYNMANTKQTAFGNIMSQVYGMHMDFSNKEELGGHLDAVVNQGEANALYKYISRKVLAINSQRRDAAEIDGKKPKIIKLTLKQQQELTRLLFCKLAQRYNEHNGGFCELVDNTFMDVLQEETIDDASS